MELISIHELEKASPLFRGRAGNAFAHGLLRMLGVSEIERRIDGFERFRGPDFAQAINAEAGMNYTVNGLPREEALEHFRGLLPKGPFITICNHTQGALDGISLIDFFGHLRPTMKPARCGRALLSERTLKVMPSSDTFMNVSCG